MKVRCFIPSRQVLTETGINTATDSPVEENIADLLLGSHNKSWTNPAVESILINMTTTNDDSTTSQSVRLKMVRITKTGPLAAVCGNKVRFTMKDIIKYVSCQDDIRRTAVPLSVVGGSGSFLYDIRNTLNR